MRFNLPILLLLVFVFSCKKEKTDNIPSARCNKNFDHICKVTYSKEVRSFNNVLNRDDEVIEEYLTYDSIGNLRSRELTIDGFDDNKVQKFIKYDQFTNVTEEEVYDTNGLLQDKISASYIDYQKPLVITTTQSLNSILKTEYTYDSNGGETSCISYNNGIIWYKRRSNPDACGNLAYYEVSNGGDSVIEKGRSTFYDYKKPLITHTEVNGPKSRHEFSYNSKGWLVELKYFYDDVLSSRRTNYKHDSHGNVTYFEEFSSVDGKIILRVSRAYQCFDR